MGFLQSEAIAPYPITTHLSKNALYFMKWCSEQTLGLFCRFSVFLNLIIWVFFLKFYLLQGLGVFWQVFWCRCALLILYICSDLTVNPEKCYEKTISFCLCSVVQFFSRSPNQNDRLCHRSKNSSSHVLWSQKNKMWNMPTERKKLKIPSSVMVSTIAWNMQFI